MIISTNLLLGQHTETINSNIPGMSMSPYSVGKKVFQFESNFYLIRENNPRTSIEGEGHGENMALRFGVLKEELEIVVAGDYRKLIYEHPVDGKTYLSGGRSLSVGAKYLIYDSFKNFKETVNVYSWKAQQKINWRKLRPSVAAYLGANLNPRDYKVAPVYPAFGPKAMILLHNNLGKGAILTSNLVANNFLDESFNYGFILTLSQAFGERFSIFVENESYFGGYKRYIFTFGATYLAMDNLQVHASISKSPGSTINNDQTYGGLGLSWRFDKFHKEVELKEPGVKTK